MAISPRYKSVSVEEHLGEWLAPIVEQKILGFKSQAEFMTQATREKVEKYVELGIHPWSRFKKEPEKTSSSAKTLTLLVVMLSAVFAIGTLSKGSITGSFIDPLSPLTANIPQIYDNYSSLIDFLVFTALFVSLAYVTIGRMFEHRGIAIAVGVVFAIALTAMEPVWGFNLKSFGPLAATIFLIVLGYFIYKLLRYFSIDTVGAGAMSFVILYLGLSLYTPSIISKLTEKIPILSLALLVVLIVAIYKVIIRVFTLREAFTVAPGVFSSAELQEYYPKAREQEQIIKKYLYKITKSATKQSSQIIAELAYLNDLIGKFGDSHEGRRLIAQKIRDISPQEHTLQQMLSYLKTTLGQIKNFDLRLFQQFKEKYLRLNPMEQRRVKEEMQDELEKIRAEEKLSEFESQWENYDENVRNNLTNAITHLNSGDIDQAKKALKEAMTYEAENAEILSRMKEFEDLLYALTKKELKALKR
ncbi:hypothetical protein HY605_04380 [Candidatus Peregrinibacteria bacterium]|nr:hypothetical protein [Candidatus Peregrinibacteria bacterium]